MTEQNLTLRRIRSDPEAKRSAREQWTIAEIRYRNFKQTEEDMARKRKRTRKQPQSAYAMPSRFYFPFACWSVLWPVCRLIGDFSPIIPDIPEYGNNQGNLIYQYIAPAAQQMQATYGVHASISTQCYPRIRLGRKWTVRGLQQSLRHEKYNPEDTVLLTTSEYYNGEWISIQANFRVYGSWAESVEDHALLFVNGTTWNPNQYTQCFRHPLIRKQPKLSRIADTPRIRLCQQNWLRHRTERSLWVAM